MSSADHWVTLAVTVEGDWQAALVAAGNVELWHGRGLDIDRALVDLAENMAVELEERGKYLPDDYVDLVDRTP